MAASSKVSSGALIPGERITGFARWNFGPLIADEAEPVPIVDVQALQQARQLGFDEGFVAGRAQALAEAQTRLDEYVDAEGRRSAERFSALLESAQRRLCDAEQIIARGTLEIACALARQVLRHELVTDPGTLEPVVREAVGMLLADGRSARVRLSPADFARLEVPLQTEFAEQSVAIVVDVTVPPGDCLIESAGAVIEGGVAQRWARAVASLGLSMPWRPEDHDAA